MITQEFNRKLAAILSADVKGYSRLMGEDETATVRTITAYRELMAKLIQRHRGRVVDSPGDNLLAEFASVVDAVDCAVEVQHQLKTRNADLPENRRMEFRIGINLGDVIEEQGRLYGDGVNIAARVESLAEAGGICISGSAYEQVENKLDLAYTYLGEHIVKNIVKPVRVYQVLMESDATVSRNTEAPDLPDKPSIAVLPFVNMSGDPEQEYFSDGMTEDLITDLSKISGLFVIARNSVFTYKGNPVKIQQVSKDLGVRYVLEGSVRKAGDRVRITAQLVDAITGGHLWAERYDRNLGDIFALQDEVTQNIVAVLAVKLGEGERKRLLYSKTENVVAYDYFLRGLEYFNRFTKEANMKARQMFEKAIELDSHYAFAYVKLAWTHLTDWMVGWSQDPESLDRTLELAQKAISLDDSMEGTYCLLGNIYLWKKQHEEAIALYEKFIALNPNFADGLSEFGNILNFSGKPEEAIDFIEKAMRLDPLYPAYNLFNLGHARYLIGQREDALAAMKGALEYNPNFFPPRAFLAAIYIELSRINEARAQVTEILKRSPETTLEVWRQRLPYKDPAVLERVVAALQKAGLE